MEVKELIEILQRIPEDTLLVFNAFSTSLFDIDHYGVWRDMKPEVEFLNIPPFPRLEINFKIEISADTIRKGKQ